MKTSASQLKLHNMCPQKWYYTRVMNLEEPQHEDAESGKRVHALAERLLQGQTHAEIGLEARAADELAALTHEVGQPDKIEHPFEYPLVGTHSLVRGVIDALFVEKRVIVDHKTKRRARQAQRLLKGKKFRTDPQAVLYAAWFLDEYGGDHVDLRWQYVWVPEEGDPGHPPVVVLERFTRDHVLAELEKIKKQALLMEAERANIVEPKRNFWACFLGKGYVCHFIDRCGVHNPEKKMRLADFAKKKDQKAEATTEATPEPTPEPAVHQASELPKPKKGRKKKAPTPEPTEGYINHLYVNCLPETSDADIPVVHVDTILQEAELSVAHWRMLAYQQGEAELEEACKQYVAKLTAPVDVILETATGSNRAVVPYLRSVARRVFRGIQ